MDVEEVPQMVSADASPPAVQPAPGGEQAAPIVADIPPIKSLMELTKRFAAVDTFATEVERNYNLLGAFSGLKAGDVSISPRPGTYVSSMYAMYTGGFRVKVISDTETLSTATPQYMPASKAFEVVFTDLANGILPHEQGKLSSGFSQVQIPFLQKNNTAIIPRTLSENDSPHHTTGWLSINALTTIQDFEGRVIVSADDAGMCYGLYRVPFLTVVDNPIHVHEPFFTELPIAFKFIHSVTAPDIAIKQEWIITSGITTPYTQNPGQVYAESMTISTTLLDDAFLNSMGYPVLGARRYVGDNH
jgi:hypothetical protein